jgi:valyl-tRNA synthetase
MLHPFVPFITEHLYGQLQHQVARRGLAGLAPVEDVHSEILMTAPWPEAHELLDDDALVRTFSDLQAATTGVRDARSSQGVSPNQTVTVTLRPEQSRAEELEKQAHVIQRLANVDEIRVDPSATRPKGAASLVVGDLQIFVHDLVDDDAERERLQKERKRVKKEIAICDKKLGNEKFVSRAPAEVVEKQRERKAKYVAQAEAIERALDELEG